DRVVRDLGWWIALPFVGDDMHEDRSVLHGAHVAQYGQQMIEIMPVDRADVIEAKLHEQRAACAEVAGGPLCAAGAFLPSFGQDLRRETLEEAAEAPVGAA